MKAGSIKIIAHRGSSYLCPQNTMSAFLQAKEDGAHAIEIDLRATKDNHLVVMHDKRINRVTRGRGKVSAMTIDKLLSYDFGERFGNLYRGERVPLLSQVLEFAKVTGMYINIEIKQNFSRRYDVERAAVSMCEGEGLLSRVVFSSFDFKLLLRIKELNSNCRTALLFDYPIVEPWRLAKEIGAFALHPSFSVAMKDGFIEKCKEWGIKVNVWTVNSLPRIARLIKKQPDGVITNFPHQVKRMLDYYISTGRLDAGGVI